MESHQGTHLEQKDAENPSNHFQAPELMGHIFRTKKATIYWQYWIVHIKTRFVDMNKYVSVELPGLKYIGSEAVDEWLCYLLQYNTESSQHASKHGLPFVFVWKL